MLHVYADKPGDVVNGIVLMNIVSAVNARQLLLKVGISVGMAV
jgi:hypothetical protein